MILPTLLNNAFVLTGGSGEQGETIIISPSPLLIKSSVSSLEITTSNNPLLIQPYTSPLSITVGESNLFIEENSNDLSVTN